MTIRLLITSLLLTCCCFLSYGQYGHFSYGPYGHHYYYKPYSSYNEKGKTWLKRAYMSVSLPFMSQELDSKLMIDRSAAQTFNTRGPSVDTSINLNKKCSGSYGFSSGTFFPITKINDHQMIALDASCGGYIYIFDYGPVKYSSVDLVKDKSDFYLFDLPIALMYKSGGEVSLDPEKKLLFSIGAGFDPTLVLGGYNSAGGALFKIRSFLTMEIGAYFGIAMKMKATYYPGTLITINDTESGLSDAPDAYGTFTVNGSAQGSFLLSLVFLYHSRHWKDDN